VTRRHTPERRPGAPRVAGVDGCRTGWLVVLAEASPFRVVSVRVEPRIAPLIGDVAVDVVAVDMPIGLPERSARACDVECRRALGDRRSSVFPVPMRATLGAADYPSALDVNREWSGVGLSKQAWFLVPKIVELDDALDELDAELAARVHETHPELCFRSIAGAPMAHPKRTTAGRRERLRALAPHVSEPVRARRATPRGAAPDDVLDALVLAVRAAEWVRGEPVVELGDPGTDTRGRPMIIRG